MQGHGGSVNQRNSNATRYKWCRLRVCQRTDRGAFRKKFKHRLILIILQSAEFVWRAAIIRYRPDQRACQAAKRRVWRRWVNIQSAIGAEVSLVCGLFLAV